MLPSESTMSGAQRARGRLVWAKGILEEGTLSTVRITGGIFIYPLETVGFSVSVVADALLGPPEV